MIVRTIKKTLRSQPTLEGAGVSLHRAVGFYDTALFDPFLLLDDFRSNVPDEYIRGFPWHPHRGIETITYMLKGKVEHQDSMGNRGIITGGDVQWMTAGSGIIHQEMPTGDDKGFMHGFQLWANLPASHKMMNSLYREVKKNDMPVVEHGGIKVSIISGTYHDVKGRVEDIVTDPEYFDISMPDNAELKVVSIPGHTVFLYVIEGNVFFDNDENKFENRAVVLFNDGEYIVAKTRGKSARFLYFSGKPIGEPVAWRGPIVMNTELELEKAFMELGNNTFIKK
jgi:redox-sensitive bicupin YhaK (pirin superfamily)